MVSAIQMPLFVPASRPERFAKAAASGADAIILDLEDAVAPADKDAARANVDATFTELPVILRVNAVGTEWFEQDMAAARGKGFAAIMLPKSESLDDFERAAELLPDTPIIALVETALGLANCQDIAGAKVVTRLAFGSVDFCADIGCAHLRDVLLPARTALVIASRVAGIAPPIDGVTVQIKDPKAARSDAAHAKALGMNGKLCIHPSQIPEVGTAFRPDDAELAWAKRVLASGDGAVAIDGQMVDAPVRARAQSIVSAAERNPH